MSINQFNYCRIPADAEALRTQVRQFLQQALPDYAAERRADSWMGFNAQFSRKLGARGWVGMALPKQYGGADASAFSRYVVIEELLAAGAPVSAHWFADRQSGPKFCSMARRSSAIFICRLFAGESAIFVSE